MFKFLYFFTVEGSGEFPFDMLRYDHCWPRFEREINALAPHHRSSLLRERRDIMLCGVKEPTVERWRSFGWIVQPTISKEKLT